MPPRMMSAAELLEAAAAYPVSRDLIDMAYPEGAPPWATGQQRLTGEQLVESVRTYTISMELSELLRRNHRPSLPPVSIPEPAAAPDLELIPAEHIEAAAAADAAREDIEQRIAAMYKRPAPRREDCGQRLTIHLRRAHPCGGVEDALIRASCGRSDCPRCLRRRVVQSLRRATICLLDAAPKSPAPRLGQLHVAEVPWARWPSYDRAMRRQLGGDCGRLRVRRRDDSVLVVAERPWAGSRRVSPAAALALAADAIEALHPDRHAYRQLGEWSDCRPSGWHCLARVRRCIDLAETARQLEALGTRSRKLRAPDMAALLWRVGSDEEADTLLRRVCPSLASWGDNSPPWPNSDNPSLDDSADSGQSDLEPPFPADWYDEGEPPWGIGA